MSVFNMLEVKKHSFVTEIELSVLETEILKYYADNKFVPDDYVLDGTGVQSYEALKTILCRIKQKTGLTFERKTNYGYRLKQILLINY